MFCHGKAVACTLAAFALVAPVTRGAGQRVTLELHPRAGDTLHMLLDQVSEVSAPGRDGTRHVVTTLHMYSRAIVESTLPASSTILAITDSVQVETNDEHSRELAAQTRRQLTGQAMRMLLYRDGTVSLAEPASVSRDIADVVAVMPASFPKEALAVGDTWIRVMPIPSTSRFQAPTGTAVRARFRLDSLNAGGTLAFVSMAGSVARPGAGAAVADEDAPISGTVHGTMTVNRARGWLSESRFRVEMRASIPVRGPTGSVPMRFRMVITQHMRIEPDGR